MEEYERAFLDAVAENLSASIAQGMREAENHDLVADGDELTESGRMWVRGYLTGRLAMLRSSVVGNPNLSASDVEAVASVAERSESRVAAQLYA